MLEESCKLNRLCFFDTYQILSSFSSSSGSNSSLKCTSIVMLLFASWAEAKLVTLRAGIPRARSTAKDNIFFEIIRDIRLICQPTSMQWPFHVVLYRLEFLIYITASQHRYTFFVMVYSYHILLMGLYTVTVRWASQQMLQSFSILKDSFKRRLL